MESRRQLKHKTYLTLAQELSALSTCLRLRVGCVLLRARRQRGGRRLQRRVAAPTALHTRDLQSQRALLSHPAC
jgi:hypothetical protein